MSQADHTDVQGQSKMSTKENSATAVDKSIKERVQQTKPTTTGWGSLPSTSVFRAVNFELFVKPNKLVMACGVLAFSSCVAYIAYMNLTDDNKKGTYVTLDSDGGLTVRQKTSRWN
ncbi:small integral membrane protein 8-like [Physella acuta]|uniref:small integral membrane protein 8-like n=1 Tax=Physella acuta TaxID=109671 RepID=UPI0027DB3EC7|nr:small integral membrane protein 8-like [Physella acuta]